jgi:putative tryptophan/tyrosine transport system substrate-binding protein
LLVAAVPNAKRLGILWDSSFPPALAEFKETERAARSLNLEPVPVDARGPDDFEPAVAALQKSHADAVIVIPGLIFIEQIKPLASLMAKAQLPAMYFRREQVELGGLMAYGTNYNATYRRAGALVDKILKGAKPADIPVEQPTRIELVINLKTAGALGLNIPAILLARADEVIE